MRTRSVVAAALSASFAALAVAGVAAGARGSIEITPIGSAGQLDPVAAFDEGAAEIPAYDPLTRRAFVVNGLDDTIDVLDLTNPATPLPVDTIDVSGLGSPNSVAVRWGLVAVAIEAPDPQDPGTVAFYTAFGAPLGTVPVGALPDMLTFTPNGQYVLVANEGEPSSYGQADSVDPEGSVSIVDLRRGVARATVRTAGFTAWNATGAPDGVRVFGPGATVAEDLEPEYIAVSHNSRTAWVTLQEANAIAVVDVKDAEVDELVPLGLKDHDVPGAGLDPSDRDGPTVKIGSWPVLGMFQPDAIAALHHRGETYLVTANEGDARDYTGFAEEVRVGALDLDDAVFPNEATLKQNANLGRLNVSSATGDTNGDGDLDELHAFGARSISVWRVEGDGVALVWDSGDMLEQTTAAAFPATFNASNTDNNLDSRSDNKGPEPEGLALGKIRGTTYAFVGLERIGGVVVLDLGDPEQPELVQYENSTRDFGGDPEQGTAGDLGPEGLEFVPWWESPIWSPLLLVANEVSGTTTVYRVDPA